jgi:hypothetical protein
MERKMDEQVLKPATETEILLDGEKIGDFFIKPWTISKCAEISPCLEKVLGELKKRRLTFRDFIEVKKDGEGKDTVSVLNLDQLFFVITPHVPEMMKITLGITSEELDKVKPDMMLPIAVCILRQNVGYIKNSLALMTVMVQTMAKASV